MKSRGEIIKGDRLASLGTLEILSVKFSKPGQLHEKATYRNWQGHVITTKNGTNFVIL